MSVPIQPQDLVYRTGEVPVLLDELLQIGLPREGNGKVDAHPVARHHLIVLRNILKALKPVNGLVERVEGDRSAAERVDLLHHLIGVHGPLSENKEDEHLCDRFF